MADRMYLVVEGEPFLSVCREWKRRYLEAKNAAFVFAHSMGAQGYFPGFHDELVALTPVDPVPEGWKIERKRGTSRMVPKPKQAGEVARQAIATLRAFPRDEELREMVGHPCEVRYRGANGTGFQCIGHMMHPVQLTWHDRETLFLVVPDPVPVINDIRERDPSATIEVGEWTPPAGLCRITEAEFDLHKAQAAVARERAAMKKPRRTEALAFNL